MAEFNDTYRKAGILMTSALKKYEKGDYEGGNRDREEANRLYDMAEKEVNSAQGTAMLYGENRNFGTIYKVFESNTPDLFNKKENGKLSKILKLIKENKVLKSEFDFYKALVYPESVADAEKYVNEAISIMPSFNKQQIIENNQKFIDAIRKLELSEMVDISDDDIKLYEAVEYLMLNKKTYDNLNEYVKAKKCITEHIEKNCNYCEINNESIDEVYHNGLNQINEKYDGVLNGEEKMFVDKLSKLTNKESYFDMAKLDAIKSIDSQLKECSDENKKGLECIIENISKKKYNDSNFIADVAEFREIKNTLIKESTDNNDRIQSLATKLAKIYKGETTGDSDWVMTELSYNTPNNVDATKISDDVKELSSHYDAEDVGYMVISKLLRGDYRGEWSDEESND